MKMYRNIAALFLTALMAIAVAPLAPVSAQTTTLSLSPTPVGAGSLVGNLVLVDVVVTDVVDLDSWEASIAYDPAVLAAADALYTLAFDLDRAPTFDNVNGFLVVGQASILPPGASLTGTSSLATLAFQVLCEPCSSSLHFADSKLQSFAGAIAHTTSDGFFSNTGGGILTFYADLNGRRAWAEHNRFRDARDGPMMTIFARIDNFGNSAPTAARAVWTLFDEDAGLVLGTFQSAVHVYTFQGEKHTFSVDVSKHPQTVLSDDSKIVYNDVNGNGVRDVGESIAYDVSGDGCFGLCESIDTLIKFRDTTVADGVWTPRLSIALPAETVVYDSNNNDMYDTGERVILGTTPSAGAVLSSDPGFRFFDLDGNGVQNLIVPPLPAAPFNEPVVVDADGDSFFELQITGSPPTEPFVAGNVAAPGQIMRDDPNIKYIDSNGNSVLDFVPDAGAAESVVYDANGNGVYDFGEAALAGPNPPVGYVVGHHYSVTAESEYDSNGNGTLDTLGVNDKIFAVIVLP